MSNLKAAAPAAKDGEKGRVSFAKVQRYWAGKRVDVDTTHVKDEPASSLFVARDAQPGDGQVQRTPVAPAVLVKKADPRLARLARTDVAEARGEGRQRHQRHIQEARVVKKSAEEQDVIRQGRGVDAHRDPLSESKGNVEGSHGLAASGADLTADAVDAERQARRERALQAQREQANQNATDSESEYESDEESYASGSSDEERRLAKPVFVTKGDRETVLEKEKAELEEAQLKEDEQKRKESRQKETAAIVAEMVDQEKQAATSKQATHLNTPSDIDTDSDTDDEDSEFERWQRRELERIKREEAIRNPSSKAEKTAELGQAAAQAARGKVKFMQKYFHKGAFFQTEADDDRGTVGGDAIYMRDFTGATGEDKFDKEALPAVMQVKKFGRAGRTKWTHLANEDTSAVNTTYSGPQHLQNDFTARVYPESGAPDVFMKMKQAAEAKGGGRPGSVGDGLSKPRKMRT